MRGTTIDQQAAMLSELVAVADGFADRARLAEERRDKARPGTGGFHQHAHSATLWREAEARLRTKVRQLELSASGWSSTWEFAD